MKKFWKPPFSVNEKAKKLILTMKLTVFIVFLTLMQVSATVYSQATKFSFRAENKQVVEVLRQIEDNSDFRFFFLREQVDVERKVTVTARDATVEQILEELFRGQPVSYEFANEALIVLTRSDNPLGSVNSYLQGNLQQPAVSGKVNDSSGQPLPGVTVVIKGTTRGTVTNADGEYSLTNIPEDATLVFSFVGMRTQETTVGDQTRINVTMEVDAIGIEEVVAVGYGVQKKVNLTGSVGVIDAEKLENRSVGRLEQALQGQVSGLKIVQTTGQPGNEAIDILIRGKSTFTDNPALTLIDGIPSSINQINPNDIESISVLKDASSTAIYGARAAGGVILITTKKGKTGKPRVSYDNYVGFQQPSRFPEKVTAYEHAILFTEGEMNDDPNRTTFKYTDEDIARFSSSDWADHNWAEAILSDALQTQHNISVSGGSETQDYYVSGGYLYQDGIVINTGFEKYTFQYNQNIKLSEKFKLGFNGSFISDKRTAPSEASVPGDGNVRGVIHLMDRVYRWGNTIPFKTPNGDWATVEGGLEPSAIGINSEEGGQQILKRKKVLGKFNLDYSITKNLKLTGIYGINWEQNRQRDFSARMKFYDPDNPDDVTWDNSENALLITNSSSNYQNSQLLINYDKIFDAHSVSVLAGYTREWLYQDSETVGRRDFLTDDIYAISAGSADRASWTTAGVASDWALASYIGRISYSYKDKYLAEAAMRYDGSSRFVEKIRWGFFPSFSAGWRITEEDFLKDNDILTYLKLRLSWGQVGNQNVGYYPFADILAIGEYYFNNAVQKAVYTPITPNPELTWETKTGSNLGLDGNIKNGLFSFEFDVFKERTEDILLNVPVPTAYGKPAPVQNAGIVDNKGWELELGHRNSLRDFSYGITFQISDATNKVIDLYGTGPWIDIANNNITEEGHPMYEWYGYKAEGFFQSEEEVQNHSFQAVQTGPGDIKYQENGGNPNTITPDDRVRLGRSDPRFPYGVRINLDYRNFDLIAFGQGVMSHKVFNNGWTAYNFDRSYSTLFKYHLDRWTPETPNARFPKTRIGGSSLNAQFSSFWLENAAYFRLKNVQLGYNVPQNVLTKFKLERARIYLSGENLLTFTKLLGFDPEIPTGTTTRLVEKRYPLSKIYNIGINLTF